MIYVKDVCLMVMENWKAEGCVKFVKFDCHAS